MKTLQIKIFHFLLLISSVLLFLPTLGEARITIERHDLECCDSASCPTILNSPGEEGVVQTVVFETEIFPISGMELPTPSFGDPGYKEWRNGIRSKYSKEVAGEIVKTSKTSVLAKCPSLGRAKTISKKTKQLTCPEDDGVIIIDCLKCFEDSRPYSIIWIIKTKSEKERDEVLKIFDEAKESGIAIEDFVVENGDLFNKVDDEVWEVVPPPQPGLDRPGVYPMNPDYVGEDEDLDEYIANIKREFDERQARLRKKQEEIQILENRNRDIMGVFMGSLLSGSGSGF